MEEVIHRKIEEAINELHRMSSENTSSENKEADDKQDESNEQKEYFKRIVQQLSEGYNEGKRRKIDL